MGLSDIGNLLDSDGNLQNELLVFAFAATLLATIPILLGNEFDVNIGLRRRRGADERRATRGTSIGETVLTSDGEEVLPSTGEMLLPSDGEMLLTSMALRRAGKRIQDWMNERKLTEDHIDDLRPAG